MKSGITVLVINYNYAFYIEECINSILAQTRPADRIIILDDCSTDNSKEVIKAISNKNDLEYYINEENRGISYTLSRGFDLIETEYYSIISADDLWDTRRLELLEATFKELKKDVGFIGTDVTTIAENGDVIERQTLELAKNDPNELRYLFLEGKISISVISLMYRTVCVREIGGYDEWLRQEDFDLMYRLFCNFNYYHLSESTVFYRQTNNSLSRKEFSSSMYEEKLKTLLKITKDSFFDSRVKIIFNKQVSHLLFSIYQLKGDLRFFIADNRLKEILNFKNRLILIYIRFGFPRKFIRIIFKYS